MRSLFFFIALLFLKLSLAAQSISPARLSQKWDASWITVPGSHPHDYGVYHFRKKWMLSTPPDRLVVHVSGDNRYKLYVNGQLVSLGPARGDIFNWNFETVDLSPYLKTGDNVLAAVVWNFGEDRAEAQISYQTAFILQADEQAWSTLNTGTSWRCMTDSAYQPLAPELNYVYYAAGPMERIDYNHYPLGWTATNFPDENWPKAKALFSGLPKGVFFWTLGWMLVPRPIPMMELTQQRIPVIRKSTGLSMPEGWGREARTVTIPARAEVSLLLDQEYLTTAYPCLRFSGGKDSRISLGYAEGLFVDEGSGKDWRAQNQKGNRSEISGKRFVGVRDEVISGGGENQEFIPLAWRTYRYVEMKITTADQPLRIDDFFGWYEGYPFRYTARFESDDASLNQILSTGWRTARLCAHETYMDCPYYEQLQYGGDTRIQALVSLFNSGDDRLMRNAIEQLRNSLMPEGITMSRYPTAHAQEIPTFSLIWISMLHDYWWYRGDSAFIRRQLPVARMILDYFSRYQQKDGSLRNVPYWNFTDWVDDKGWNAGVAPIGKDGASAAQDLQLLLALQAATQLEQQTGMTAFVSQYAARISQLQQTVRSKYRDRARNLFADTREHETYSQHCNALAILTGVVNGKEATQLANSLLADTSLSKASVYFRYYLHQAIDKAGLGDRYLSLLGKWRENLQMGMTTWAEMEDVNRSRSDCHAWGSSPNIELFRIVLGIDSDSPGFEKVRITPHPGSLKNLTGSMPHPKGEIRVSYHQQPGGNWKVEIDLPGVAGKFFWKGKAYPLTAGHNSFTL